MLRFPLWACVSLGLLLLLAVPLQAVETNAPSGESSEEVVPLPPPDVFGFILPEVPAIWQESENEASPNGKTVPTLKVTLGAMVPYYGVGIPLEYPQSFTVLRYQGETSERSEHLSVLEETTVYGARGWTTSVVLPRSGIYHFVMQSKAVWVSERDRFIQYLVRVQIPVAEASQGWDKPAETGFELMARSRPFGLSSGMSFTGRIVRDAKPVSDTIVDVSRLTDAVPVASPTAPPDDSTAKRKKKSRKAEMPASLQAVQQVKTDSGGNFVFTCPTPGWWVFSASGQGDPLKDPSGSLKPLEIRTQLWVFIASEAGK